MSLRDELPKAFEKALRRRFPAKRPKVLWTARHATLVFEPGTYKMRSVSARDMRLLSGDWTFAKPRKGRER